jgi:hypothetical protein
MRALLLISTLAAAPLAAQSDVPPATRDSIVAVAKRLFDGMRAHDSTMVRSVFAPGAMMMGQIRPGQPVTFSSVDGFVQAVARPDAPWDEQIYDPIVQVDGNLASLWVFYTFHHGERFTHCGVDAIQLVRTGDGWKISLIADTRRQDNCETAGRRKV